MHKTFIQFLVEQTEPLYVSRPLVNTSELTQWAKSVGLDTVIAPEELHVTIVYSKAPVEWDDFTEDKTPLVARGGERSLQVFGKGAVVLTFKSPELDKRHQQFMDAGASFDFPEYTSHVTLTYNLPEGLDITKIVPYQGELKFGGEKFEQVNTEKEFKEN